MAEYVTVCRREVIPEGGAKAFTVGKKTIALFHTGGEYHAIDDMCPHMGASLADGQVENGIVTCSWHGWRYRLADGAWADCPKVKIGCYAVRVLGEEVQVAVDQMATDEHR